MSSNRIPHGSLIRIRVQWTHHGKLVDPNPVEVEVLDLLNNSLLKRTRMSRLGIGLFMYDYQIPSNISPNSQIRIRFHGHHEGFHHTFISMFKMIMGPSDGKRNEYLLTPSYDIKN